MRHPQDAPAVIGFLHGDALAHTAKAIELVVRHQRHVVGHGLLGAVLRGHHLWRGHPGLSKNGGLCSVFRGGLIGLDTVVLDDFVVFHKLSAYIVVEVSRRVAYGLCAFFGKTLQHIG